MTPRLFALSADTPAELEQATEELATRLAGGLDPPAAPPARPWRRFVLAGSAAEAASRLRAGRGTDVITGQSDPRRPVVFLFPGVGDQYPGMAAGLYRQLPVFRRELDLCLRLLAPEIPLDLRALLFPADPPATASPNLASLFDQRGSNQQIHQTLAAQPLAFATQYAMAKTLLSLGVRPSALLGYSLGEYVAGCLAGVFSLGDAVRVIARRARLVSGQPEGAMLAVTLPPEPLEPHLRDGVSIAALDGPELTILAGPVEPIEQLGKLLLDREIACRRLATTHAFHSAMMDPVVEPLRDGLAAIALNPPSVPFLSNVTGTWITAQQATDPGYWAGHAAQPIRFADDLAELWRLREPIPVELGPGQTLTNLAVRHPGSRASGRASGRAGSGAGGRALALRTLPGVFESRTDLELLLTTVGRLWTAGTDIDWPALTVD